MKTGQKLTGSLTGTIFLKTYGIYMVVIRHGTSVEWLSHLAANQECLLTVIYFFNNSFQATSEENKLRFCVEETQMREDTPLHWAVLDSDSCSNRFKAEI